MFVLETDGPLTTFLSFLETDHKLFKFVSRLFSGKCKLVKICILTGIIYINV